MYLKCKAWWFVNFVLKKRNFCVRITDIALAFVYFDSDVFVYAGRYKLNLRLVFVITKCRLFYLERSRHQIATATGSREAEGGREVCGVQFCELQSSTLFVDDPEWYLMTHKKLSRIFHARRRMSYKKRFSNCCSLNYVRIKKQRLVNEETF